MSLAIAVLDDTPVAYYKLDEPSGTTAADSSGNSRTGAYSGSGVTYAVAGPGATGLTGITLDGSNGEVALGAAIPATLGINAPQTFEFWLKAASTVDNTTSPQLMVLAEAADDQFYLVLGESTSLLTDEVATVISITVDGSGRSGFSSFSLSTGWHHVVFTYDGTRDHWLVYVDGVSTGTPISHDSGCRGMKTDNATPVLGRQGATPFRSALSFSNVAIYASELSAGRVAVHYRAAFGGGLLDGLPRGVARGVNRG